MSDTNIGAENVTLNYEGSTPATFDQVAGDLYDPLPELALSRESLDDTHTGSKWERSKAGMRKAGGMQYKLKTTAAGLATIKEDFKTGKERSWQFVVPSDSADATGGKETFEFKAWISELKILPSMKDETFVVFSFNVNEVKGY